MSKLPDVRRRQQWFSGERLRLIREAHNLRQEDFAEVVGVSRTQILNLERGNSEISIALLMVICLEYDVRADWLLGLTDELPDWMEMVEVTRVVGVMVKP